MLWECWQYLRTPCPRAFRRIGYLRESIGIASRYRRASKEWEQHRSQCHQWICECVEQCRTPRKVLVLGSGWLIDIPIQTLLQTFKEVQLLDIVHPPVVRKLARDPSVKLMTWDLSGIVEAIDGSLRSGRDATDHVLHATKDLPMECWDADLIISANVFSQLPRLPLNYWKRKSGKISDAQVASIARGILNHHYRFLTQYAGNVCFITDTAAVTLDRKGEVVHREDLLYGFELPVARREWTWDLAPYGEIEDDRRTFHQVVAFNQEDLMSLNSVV
jgi:hypothetical protein